MPEVEIVKLKIRRGTDSQRSETILEQGELGYTSDFKRLWVGDGVLGGGSIVGNIVHDSNQLRTTISTATKGDVVYENGKLYRLNSTTPITEADWEFIGTKVDSTFIEYNTQNEISLKDSCITTTQIDSSIVLSTGGINFSVAEGISINVDNITIEKPNNSLQLKSDSVDEAYIKSSTFTNGLTGGSGDPVGINVNSNYLGIDNNELILTGIPNGVVNTFSLSSGFIGHGLRQSSFDNSLQASLQAIDTSVFSLSSVAQPVGGSIDTIMLKPTFVGDSTIGSFDTTSYDKYGKITGSSSVSIGLGLSAVNNSIEAVFQDINTDNLEFSEITSGPVGNEVTKNTLDLKDLFGSSETIGAFDNITYDKYGRVESTSNDLDTPLESNNTTTDYLTGAFNGSLDQTTYTDQTVFDVLDGTGTVSLSSAGFIKVDLGDKGIIAIPVFRPPSP